MRGAYLEAIARLAAEATARGEVESARHLLNAAVEIVRHPGSETSD